jgi:hypothetical protein
VTRTEVYLAFALQWMILSYVAEGWRAGLATVFVVVMLACAAREGWRKPK